MEYEETLPISLSLIDNHIIVMETVNMVTTYCVTGLEIERLKGKRNSTCSFYNLDFFSVNE